MTREAFLAWVEQQPSGRFEGIDGIVVAMAPERALHNLRKGAAPDDPRIVRHSRAADGQVATEVVVAGEIALDPPGLTVALNEFYVD